MASIAERCQGLLDSSQMQKQRTREGREGGGPERDTNTCCTILVMPRVMNTLLNSKDSFMCVRVWGCQCVSVWESGSVWGCKRVCVCVNACVPPWGDMEGCEQNFSLLSWGSTAKSHINTDSCLLALRVLKISRDQLTRSQDSLL